jgi:prepilin-type N-terminal cleavage/methylation domain-containing protein
MKNQEGFSIMEVLVALIIMSIILTTLGGLTFVTAQQSVRADNSMVRQAASLEMVNRFATMPYNSVAASAGCDTVGTLNNRYERCAVVSASGNALRVNVTTTPLQRGIPASVVSLVRNAPPIQNPLCTSGC